MTRQAMVPAVIVAFAALVLVEGRAHAQGPEGRGARGERFEPRVYVSAWAGGFTNLGSFAEGEDDAFFRFDGSFSYGGGVHFDLGNGLIVGVDGAYATTEYERWNRQTVDLEERGDASVASGLVSTRLATAGGAGFGLYLTVGAGVFAYNLKEQQSPGVEEWDTDLALNAGAGLDYRFAPRFGVFLEWSQIWAYHEKEGGVSRNTAKHNLVKLGGRFGI